jgi:hypothetical protein
MVYYPFFPVLDLFQLICGVMMIIPASFAIKKVSEGSNNQFAYVLLSFTVLLGIAYVGMSFCEAFRREVFLPDRTYHFSSEYAFGTFYYFQYISAL